MRTLVKLAVMAVEERDSYNTVLAAAVGMGAEKLVDTGKEYSISSELFSKLNEALPFGFAESIAIYARQVGVGKSYDEQVPEVRKRIREGCNLEFSDLFEGWICDKLTAVINNPKEYDEIEIHDRICVDASEIISWLESYWTTLPKSNRLLN